ncbi:DUF302 domain-containing protein [Kribbella sp. NPDC023972]|uniref:DUF302 domain-containing protein n=1 Tax=Kribbella sp. NPDC023972 TaxID=3154795 RepID=UPI0033EE30BD
MATEHRTGPAGVRSLSGVTHQRSPVSVAETVLRLSAAIRSAGSTPFFVIDHSGEAQRAGTELRDTKVLGFEDPVTAAPIMLASPLAALDLPLRLLVWKDDGGVVWVSYVDPAWLAKRHHLPEELAVPLQGVEQLIAQATAEETD